MKGMEFASSGGDEKAAAFGDALAESVLDEPDAEEQDVGGDDGEGGAGAGEDAANEKEEEEEEAPFDENLRPFCGSSLARSARSPAAKAPRQAAKISRERSTAGEGCRSQTQSCTSSPACSI